MWQRQFSGARGALAVPQLAILEHVAGVCLPPHAGFRSVRQQDDRRRVCDVRATLLLADPKMQKSPAS